ncbi:hypothetical protein GGQ91_000885 [Methylobacterium fujisawaense]|uniref:Uncharacterized protein n=1 Tax=Methylobacterium fujisawaense TaxID=107400 RepID=A0ABR6D854_9HYPH|nr:hypothetical protein [Methylobacterium fujisawaense]MBA9061524.1 hypothetical protein [Methylobacterium fujisawaense]
MELRIALAEIDRALKANDPTSGGSAAVAANEDDELQIRLLEQYGPVRLRAWRKKRLRDHVRFAAPAERDSEEYQEPVIQPAPSPLRRRLLTAFYGGMSLPYDPFFAHEYAAVEDLARWIGRLRREGHATLDRRIAWDLRDIVDKNLLALDRMLDEPDAAGAEALLVELLPVAGWEALIEAADRIAAGEREAFPVSYHLVQAGDIGPGGGIDGAAGSVTIRGPFLMLPLRAAGRWRDRARQIPPQGLYID